MRHIKAAVLPALLLSAGAATAAPYGGLDANRYSISLKSSAPEAYPQSAGGIGLYLGDRFGNLAGEIGYGTSTASGTSGTIANGDSLHLTRVTIDGLFYVPIGAGLNILFTGGGAETNYGVSQYLRNSYQENGQYKTSNADLTLLHGDEFDWRAGGGLAFTFDNFELRTVARYQPLSMGGQAQNALSIEVGLNMYL